MDKVIQKGIGKFGPIYEGLKGKEAENFLIQKRDGEMLGAYTFEKRPVDLIRGSYNKGTKKGIGLAKIVEKHPEVLGRIQELLDDLPLLKLNQKEIVLGNDNSRAVIRLQWDGEEKRRLMTAYDLI